MRAEHRKWQNELAVAISKARANDPEGAHRLAQDFADALFVVIAPGSEKKKFFLPPGGSLLVGRDPSCDIVVDDPMVSLNHLRLASREDSVWLSDLHSTGGAEVNGTQISKAVVLDDSDVITIGRVEIVFHALRKGA
jgi:pSer/pThr/pTyr-binding forkhead associated (FHA) protein